MASNPARRRDRQRREAAELSEPCEIRVFLGPFAVHVGAKKSGTIRLKLGNHIARAECQTLSPAARGDAALLGIKFWRRRGKSRLLRVF